jgi:hypothetical protein
MIARTVPIRKRRKARRGSFKDKARREWILTLPCAIADKHECVGRTTGHHVRSYGGPKSDARLIPLCVRAHLYEAGKDSVEHGKRKFEERYGVDLEALVVKYDAMYQTEKGQ